MDAFSSTGRASGSGLSSPFLGAFADGATWCCGRVRTVSRPVVSPRGARSCLFRPVVCRRVQQKAIRSRLGHSRARAVRRPSSVFCALRGGTAYPLGSRLFSLFEAGADNHATKKYRRAWLLVWSSTIWRLQPREVVRSLLGHDFHRYRHWATSPWCAWAKSLSSEFRLLHDALLFDDARLRPVVLGVGSRYAKRITLIRVGGSIV